MASVLLLCAGAVAYRSSNVFRAYRKTASFSGSPGLCPQRLRAALSRTGLQVDEQCAETIVRCWGGENGRMRLRHFHSFLTRPDEFSDQIGYEKWWASDATEVLQSIRLEVQGSIPNWIAGSLIRVGPGEFELGRQRLQHQIDGLAKLTKYRIKNGVVEFQTRMLQTSLYNRTRHAITSGLGTEPAILTLLPVQPTYTPCQRIRALVEESAVDNTNIFVWQTGRTAHVCSDSSIASNAFDVDTLESRGHLSVKLTAPRRIPDTITGAHRQRVINDTATVGWGGRLEIRQDKLSLSSTVVSLYKDDENDDGMVTRRYIGQVRIPLAHNGLPMIHSFQVTSRYVLLLVCSLRVEPRLVGSTFLVLNEPFAGINTLGWRGRQNASIYVMDLHSTSDKAGPVRVFSIDPMFMNHHINAWEEKDSIIMDVIAYRDGSFLSNPRGLGNLAVMRNEAERNLLKTLRPTVRRYTLDMRTGVEPLVVKQRARTTAQPVYDASWVPFRLVADREATPNEWPRCRYDTLEPQLHMEMPRFNNRRHGLSYRYVWGVGSPEDTPTHVSGLVKVDLGDPSSAAAVRAPAILWYKSSHYPSEPIFIPRPGGTREDDGVILAVMLDGLKGSSYLLILNASTMKTIGTALSPVVMPSDFHGEWFADS